MKHKEVSEEALYRIQESLEIRYNKFSESVERNEHCKEECRGGCRFASLIGTVRERTKDRETVREAWKTLYDIAGHPSAGSIS